MRFDVLVKGAESTKIGHIFFNCVDPVFRGGYRVESIQNLSSRWGISTKFKFLTADKKGSLFFCLLTKLPNEPTKIGRTV